MSSRKDPSILDDIMENAWGVGPGDGGNTVFLPANKRRKPVNVPGIAKWSSNSQDARNLERLVMDPSFNRMLEPRDHFVDPRYKQFQKYGPIKFRTQLNLLRKKYNKMNPLKMKTLGMATSKCK